MHSRALRAIVAMTCVLSLTVALDTPAAASTLPPPPTSPPRTSDTTFAASAVSTAINLRPSAALLTVSIPFGTVLIPGANWAGQAAALGDLNVYSNGDDTQMAFGAYGEEFQCVELAVRWAAISFGESVAWSISRAADMYAAGASMPIPFAQEPNGGPVGPVFGDIMVFAATASNQTGHVAVVSAVTATTVSLVEQNFTWNGVPQGSDTIPISGTTISAIYGLPVIGWLHGRSTPPSAPTSLSATAEPSAVSLTWTAPAGPVTAYQITASLDGVAQAPVITASATPAYTATGLLNGHTYSFTVTAINLSGPGPPSAPSPSAVPASAPPAPYHAITPFRIADTRAGSAGPLSGSTLGPAGHLDVQVAGLGGVPLSGASAAVINVTVVAPSSSGFLTVYPAGESPPLAANLNFVAGQTVPNLVEVALSPGGAIAIYNSSGFSDVVVDLEGWAGSALTPSGAYIPTSPSRIADTRTNSGEPDSGQTLTPATALTVHITGPPGTAASTLLAVVLNVAVTNTAAPGFLTAWPAGATRPLASNLNWNAGQTIANRVIVPVSGAGDVSFFASSGPTDIVIDVSGWFIAPQLSAPGSLLTAMTPTRLADTRPGAQHQGNATTLGPRSSIVLQVAGQSGIPSMSDPSQPRAVVLNVTVTNTTTPGFLTIWPGDTLQPTASDLNWSAGETAPNLVIAALNAAGQVTIFNSSGQTDVVVDAAGWFA